jgi:hypothetical protein
MTRGCAPASRSSSGVKVRPREAPTPSTEKYVPETSSVATRSVWPPKLRAAGVPKRQNMPENTWLLSRRSRYIGWEIALPPQLLP